MRLGYGNICKRRYSGKVRRDDEPTYLGMRNNDGGAAVLAELGRAVLDGEAAVRSADVHHEMTQCDKDEEGKPVFPRAEKSHGDRVQGLALAWFAARHRVEPAKTEEREAAKRKELGEASTLEKRGWTESWTLAKVA
jgi:hypothetical protein